MIIRPASIEDIPAVTAIYNEAILTTDATFDTEPKTIENRTEWFLGHDSRNPVIVAELNNTVIGWASLSKWSDRQAYADTTELSLYVYSNHRGNGVGRQLMADILEMGGKAGLHTVISRIVAGNDQSIHLHEVFGFEHIGTMKEVGRKFNRLLDVIIMQKIFPEQPARREVENR